MEQVSTLLQFLKNNEKFSETYQVLYETSFKKKKAN